MLLQTHDFFFICGTQNKILKNPKTVGSQKRYWLLLYEKKKKKLLESLDLFSL